MRNKTVPMTRRERLMAALNGRPVDRPPLSFYELNGLDENPGNDDPYNIYTDPSWLPLIELTRDRTDRIVMRGMSFASTRSPLDELTTVSEREEDGRRIVTTTVRIGRCELRSVRTRSRDVNTWWQVEHLLKTPADIEAYLSVPPGDTCGAPDTTHVLETEERLGDTGIVMIDTGDPLCAACSLIEMGTFTIVALTEPALFHRLLERFARQIWPRTETFAAALSGRLWRI